MKELTTKEISKGLKKLRDDLQGEAQELIKSAKRADQLGEFSEKTEGRNRWEATVKVNAAKRIQDLLINMGLIK